MFAYLNTWSRLSFKYDVNNSPYCSKSLYLMFWVMSLRGRHLAADPVMVYTVSSKSTGTASLAGVSDGWLDFRVLPPVVSKKNPKKPQRNSWQTCLNKPQKPKAGKNHCIISSLIHAWKMLHLEYVKLFPDFLVEILCCWHNKRC